MFHEYYTELGEPMTLRIDGKVQEVIGGGPENKVMRRALARAGNGDFGYVVHFTCGFHPDCVISMQSMWVDGRQILRDGVIVAPDHLAAMSRDLLSIYA